MGKSPIFQEAYGPHLVLDGRGCPREVLSDYAVIRRFLEQTPDVIGMTKITPVVLVPREDGLSGFVLIAESHLSVHCYPERGEVRVDVFSCKPFESGAVLVEAAAAFRFTEFSLEVFDRGLEFPRDIEAVKNFVGAEAGLFGG